MGYRYKDIRSVTSPINHKVQTTRKNKTMSAAENKEFIRRYLEAVSGKPKTPELVELFISEDQQLKQHIEAAEASFPLYEMIPIEIIAEGDLVCVRVRMRGVQKGAFMGIPATGREIDSEGYVTYRVVDGKIVDHWMLIDTLSMMQQLGVLPVPQAE